MNKADKKWYEPDQGLEWPQICHFNGIQVIRCCVTNEFWRIEILDGIAGEVKWNVIETISCWNLWDNWTCLKTQRSCPAGNLPKYRPIY